MKLRTDTYAKTDVAFNDITDETILKLQLMGIKLIDRKNPVCPSTEISIVDVAGKKPSYQASP
ncbi:MAG: hypothetical protein WBN06_13605 [Lysobacterales bacterium]